MTDTTITIDAVDAQHDPIIAAFVQYLASKGIQSAKVTSHQPQKPSEADNHLIRLIQLLSNGLEQAHSTASQQSGNLTEALTQYRSETDITDVYKGRIVDLQKVINGTKLPGELDAFIGRQELVVPTGAELTNAQRQRETVHEVSRLAGRVTDNNERLRAHNALLSSQVAGLLAENALLMDRISLLEDQVAALGNSAAVTMRALNKSRQTGAAMTAAGNTSVGNRSLKANETVVAGVTMDRETALWLKEVHAQLASGKKVDEALQSTKELEQRCRPSTTARRDISQGSKAATPFALHVEASRVSNLSNIAVDTTPEEL